MSLTCRFGWLLLAAVVPVLLGCEEDEVTWLPDSTGVVYRNAAQGYSVYDLRTKTDREVLKASEGLVEGVAVSPKGDQFAVVEITYADEPQLEIVLHPLRGQEVQRSGKYKFPKPKGEYDYVSTDIALEWSTGGRIVLYRGRELLGFYDPKTAGLLYINGYSRYLDGNYVGTDLLPDGTGVLAAKLPPKQPMAAAPGNPGTGPAARDPNYVPFPDPVVIDWKGGMRVIKSPAVPAPLKKMMDEAEAPCFAYYADWKNNVLQLQVQDYRLDIDPRAGTARWWSLPLNMEKNVPRRDPNSEYQIVPVGNAGTYVFAKGTETSSTLEVMNIRNRSHREIGKNLSAEGAVRSPDGNKIAVTVTERVPEKKIMRRKVVIIDHTGAELVTLNRGELPYEDTPPMADPAAAPPVAVPAERAPPAAPPAPAPAAPPAPW